MIKWSSYGTTPPSAIADEKILIDVPVNLGGTTLSLTNVVLIFDVGLKITNGVITDTYFIDADPHQQIFDMTLTLTGVWQNAYLSVKWFGAKGTSPYLPDSTYTALYGLGSDDTPYINYVARLMKGRGGQIYVPTGCYWVRNQTPYYDQRRVYAGRYVGGVLTDNAAQAVVNGDVNAIYLFDNTTLFGDGRDTKICIVDYQTAADYSSTNPAFKTKTCVGLAQREQDEFTDAAGVSFWNTTSQSTMKFFKLGRDNVVVRDVLINCRTSVDPVVAGDSGVGPGAIYISRIGAIFVTHTTSGATPFLRGNGIVLENCTFYDCNMGASYKNQNTSFKGVKNGIFRNNYVEKGYNKGFEISGADGCLMVTNYITKMDVGLQFIGLCLGGLIDSNVVELCTEGINLTTNPSRIRVNNNRLQSYTTYGLRFRDDNDVSTAGQITEDVLIQGNTIASNVNNSVPLSFTGGPHALDTSGFYKEYKNINIRDNYFGGPSNAIVFIGYDESQKDGGEDALYTSGIRLSGNTWSVGFVKLVMNATKSGSRPTSITRDIVFADNIPTGTTVQILGTADFITFRDMIVYGSITASSDARKKLTFDNVVLEGTLNVAANAINISNSFKAPSVTPTFGSGVTPAGVFNSY